MKKKVFKKPIEKALIFINSIIFVLIGAGIESFLNSSKNIMILILLFIIFLLNHYLLVEYTNIFRD